MSKKHYNSIANTIYREYAGTDDEAAKEVIRRIANDLEDLFKADNPNFDRNRWRYACFKE